MTQERSDAWTQRVFNPGADCTQTDIKNNTSFFDLRDRGCQYQSRERRGYRRKGEGGHPNKIKDKLSRGEA